MVEAGLPAADKPAPGRRVIVLGASNLALSLPTVIDLARQQHGGPIEVLATPGHGRSYGLSTSFMGRRLPSIASCGLWDDLASRPTVPTVGVLSDIGNDLMYGETVQQITNWLSICLQRMTAAGARVVMTRLPLGSLNRLSPTRYRLLRRLLFPANRIPLNAALDQAAQLDQQIETLGATHGAALVELSAQWYGLDPIHIRRSSRRIAWNKILSHFDIHADAKSLATLSWRERLHLIRLRPHERFAWGRTQRRAQPAGRLADGTTVSLY